MYKNINPIFRFDILRGAILLASVHIFFSVVYFFRCMHRSTWKALPRLLHARNFVLLGKIVNYLPQLSYLKERSYLIVQEIFNKVEQNQLQRT